MFKPVSELIGNIFLYGVFFAVLIASGIGLGLVYASRGIHFTVMGGAIAGLLTGGVLGVLDVNGNIIGRVLFGTLYGVGVASSISTSISIGKRFSEKIRYFVWILSGALTGLGAAALLILLFPNSRDAIPNIISLAFGVITGVGVTYNRLEATLT